MPRLLRFALVAAGGVVLAMLVRQVGVGTIVDLLVRVGWAFPIVALLYFLHICVRAAALWRCTACSDTAGGLRYRDVLRVRLSGEAVEMLTLTGPFLAEPAKGVMLTRHGVTRGDAIRAVASEYGLYTLTSAWMAAFALVLLVSRGVLPPAFHTPVLGVVVAMIAATIGVGIAAAVGWIPISAPRLAQVVAIELAGQALLASEILITVRVLGFAFTSLQSVIVEGAVKFISIVFFFVPGQIGASESVYTWLFTTLHFPAAIGLTMALVRRVRALIVAAVALVVTYVF
jgi:lysylphosphatidylglycerol synthase-like protein